MTSIRFLKEFIHLSGERKLPQVKATAFTHKTAREKTFSGRGEKRLIKNQTL